MDKQNLKEIEIIYEDKDVLVLNKPSGLLVHSDGHSKDRTLLDWLHENYPEIKGVGEPQKLSNGEIIDRPGIVHRLDRDTSGVIVVAKNQKTFEFLKDQFKNREINKIYYALVHGDVKDDKGRIEASIARSKSDFRKWSAQRGKRGKEREAITEYKVLKRYSVVNEESKSSGRGRSSSGSEVRPQGDDFDPKKIFTLLEVHPKTGRTHQIRVHMKYINHPVVCDKLYAPKLPCPIMGIDRLGLHSSSIEFSLPNGKVIKAEAPLPEEFQQLLTE